MTTRLTLTFSTKAFEALAAGRQGRPNIVQRIVVEVSWFETVKVAERTDDVVPRSLRVEAAEAGGTERDIGTPLNDTITVAVLKSDGTASSIRSERVSEGAAHYTVTAADIEALLAAENVAPLPATLPTTRSALLVPIGMVRPDFVRSTLAVAAVDSAAELAADEPLGEFGFSESRTSAVELSADAASELVSMHWSTVHLGVDGGFTATFVRPVGGDTGPAQPAVGWVWWLNGDHAAVGFVHDELVAPNRTTMTIPLPAFAPSLDDAGGEAVGTPPAVVTETELVNNPGIYREDPGAFCKPFSNPERVISEKAFAVIARVQQPDIGPLSTAKLKGQHLLDFEPAPTPRRRERAAVSHETGAVNVEALASAFLTSHRPIRFHEPPEAVEEAMQLSSGRTDVGPSDPVQWEDDIAQYQAATVALGHILEFRVRTRSNGYSLGNVASTLTLAPRQVKRIQKIEFERIERARREEFTQQLDRVSDELTRERDYNDTVSAYLDEWSTGSSRSGSSAAAGGFGFAVPPVVGGVGGGTSRAWSSSEQQGERHAGASEQQRLRDAIRRHGDSLRRLQSVVVTEVTQQETVTGTTEVLRNPNYGHSLTVIYYQILRHLAVSTEFAGVRECLFVPFAIRPWTLQRAYRWRDCIRRYLRAPQHATAVRNLRDVITQFQYSSVVPGMRAEQKLTYLQGSAYVTLAVERPGDTADGKFDAAKWTGLAPYLGMPAQGIWARLAERAETVRDQEFQRQHAPTIAAKWVNSLRLHAGADLHADFTLATRYEFNRSVRIDFSVPVAEAVKLDRQRLVNMTVEASTGLPVGSTAKVTRLTMRYGAANFQRTIEGVTGTGDLLDPGSAQPDPGADVVYPLDAWDLVDEQAAMRHGVAELIEHLNEHVEFYHKAVWWCMDRDRLLMLLDGFYVPGTNNVSLASVVDREPIAIMGNCLVYRVGGGTFVGYGSIATPGELYELYAGREPAQDPLLLSLPTDGLYAQTIMDECLALEEHYGSVDWALNETEPELGEIDPSLLASRRAEVGPTLAATPMGGTIINLQNAPDAPAPTGLGGVLDAVTNANAFRDMAGLAGTQANAAAALQTAAGLATNFGNQAAALKLAQMAKSAQSTASADQRLATVQRAVAKDLVSQQTAQGHADKILEELHAPTPSPPHEDPQISNAIEAAAGTPGSTIEAITPDGQARVLLASTADDVVQQCGFPDQSGGWLKEQEVRDQVVAAAEAEQVRWISAAPASLLEEDNDEQFGHLVRFWLEVNAAIPTANMASIETALRDPSITPTNKFRTLLGPVSEPQTNVDADVATVAANLIATVPNPGTPANLQALVGEALRQARRSSLDDALPEDDRRPWSAVFVNTVVRDAERNLGLEGPNSAAQALLELNHQGAHWRYVRAAHLRRFGRRLTGGRFDRSGRQDGTYHAFAPDEHRIERGDIIVQDRRGSQRNPLEAANVFDVADSQTNQGIMHADIVVEVNTSVARPYAETIGGNVGNSARRRRFPLNADGTLVVDLAQNYVQQLDSLTFPNLPAAPARGTGANNVAGSSTRRIFAVLRAVEACRVFIPRIPPGTEVA